MEAYALLEALQTALTPEVTALGGVLQIHGHEADAIACLETRPGKWRAVLLADEESLPAEDGLQFAGVVTHKIKALVQHQEGPILERGTSLWNSGAGDVSLLQRCTQLRMLIMRCKFVRPAAGGGTDVPAGDADHETGWNYLGRQPYAPGGTYYLRSFQLSFTCRAGLLTPDYSTAEPSIPARLLH